MSVPVRRPWVGGRFAPPNRVERQDMNDEEEQDQDQGQIRSPDTYHRIPNLEV